MKITPKYKAKLVNVRLYSKNNRFGLKGPVAYQAIITYDKIEYTLLLLNSGCNPIPTTIFDINNWNYLLNTGSRHLGTIRVTDIIPEDTSLEDRINKFILKYIENFIYYNKIQNTL